MKAMSGPEMKDIGKQCCYKHKADAKKQMERVLFDQVSVEVSNMWELTLNPTLIGGK
jgi:hypothetical protein